MLNTQQQRALGAELSGVLDKYELKGVARIVVLLQVVWGEAQLLQMTPAKLGTTALKLWQEKTGGAPPGFY